MKHYTDTIPLPLAEKLKEKGMPLGSYVYTPNGMVARKDEANLAYYDDQLVPYCDYGFVFDWLMSEKDIRLNVVIKCDYLGRWYPVVNERTIFSDRCFDTWHEAANAAIEKALTLF